jgi:hypothetical protein
MPSKPHRFTAAQGLGDACYECGYGGSHPIHAVTVEGRNEAIGGLRLPEDPKDRELLALRTQVKMDETLIKGLRLRSDRQAEEIARLHRKVEGLEKELEEVTFLWVGSYGGTD